MALCIELAGFHIIGGIDLDAGLGGQDFQPDPAFRVLHPHRPIQCGRPRFVQDKIMVETACQSHLGIIRIHARTDDGGLAEIERCATHCRDLAGWNLLCIGRRHCVGIHLQLLSQDRAGTGQVEIDVVGEIDHGWRVTGRDIIQPECILRHAVGDFGRDGAGKALVTVRAHQPQAQRRAAFFGHIPQARAPGSPATAMQRDPARIRRQGVVTPFDGDAVLQTVGIAANQAIPPAAGLIGRQVLETQNHIAAPAIRAGDGDGRDGPAHVQDGGSEARLAPQGKGVDRSAIFSVAIVCARHAELSWKVRSNRYCRADAQSTRGASATCPIALAFARTEIWKRAVWPEKIPVAAAVS